MPRTVTLALVAPSGTVLGALPPFTVASPWRQEVAEIVEGARHHHGLDVTVLRLLAADGERVTYLAECLSGKATGLRDIEIDHAPEPRRAPYAEVGGPAATLAWAASVLGPVRGTQLRTWNLSSIWRLEYAGGTAWLKEVPAFFGHEGALIGWLAAAFPGFGPVPLAVDGGRMLLADIRGDDRYGAGAGERLAMMRALHGVQREGSPAPVPALGVDALAVKIRSTVRRYGDPPLQQALDGLDERLAGLAACGIPDTLVHGDFHPGNVRGSVVLDWGDSFRGHPTFDLYRMLEGLTPGEAAPLAEHWCRWWRAAVPGCDPQQAMALLEPVVALRNAAVYADFLDRIEPAEHSYHAQDVPDWLGRAAALLGIA
jgi:Phosphotransferase enzyme family